jgi:hypothetical protein
MDGVPVLVRRNAVEESMRMILKGHFNDVAPKRRFYGKGSIVVVLDGAFMNQKVRLEEDVAPQMKGTQRIRVDFNGIKAKIEVYKLAL